MDGKECPSRFNSLYNVSIKLNDASFPHSFSTHFAINSFVFSAIARLL